MQLRVVAPALLTAAALAAGCVAIASHPTPAVIVARPSDPPPPPPADAADIPRLAAPGLAADAGAPADAGATASLPPFPPAPSRIEAGGAAAVVWVPDRKASGGFRSVWVEPGEADGGASVAREGAVIVGAADLWTVDHRTVHRKTAPCADPNTQCVADLELAEPVLRSLRTGRRLTPWRSSYRGGGGCNGTVDVQIDGAVGPVVFSRLWVSEIACGGGCPLHHGGTGAFDVDKGAEIQVHFPPEIVEGLRARALAELGDNAVQCPDLGLYRATASYRPSGELAGLYELGDAHFGMCGGAQHCPNPEIEADWIPPELARWGKVPPWVARALARLGARHAFMIPAARAAAARAEMTRP